jgi:hypothetical protein
MYTIVNMYDRHDISLDQNRPDHKQKKLDCPYCGRKKQYVRYFNYDLNEYLPEYFGKCERINNCGYWLKPDQDFFREYYREKRGMFDRVIFSKRAKLQKQSHRWSTIHSKYLEMSLKKYEQNNFYFFLEAKFGEIWAKKLVNRYKIGTSKAWYGANVFWQIDEKGEIRTGKIMVYDKSSGKRSKHKFSWVHSKLSLEDFRLKQCFFGQHLLVNISLNIPIAIVESAKTATIASYFFRNYVWLATGGETMLNPEKCRVLSGRKVIFFPDLSESARKRWKGIADEVSTRYEIDTVIADLYPEINDGSDIADYLLKALPVDKVFHNILNEYGYPDDWDE